MKQVKRKKNGKRKLRVGRDEGRSEEEKKKTEEEK